jgi:hypothetical protein
MVKLENNSTTKIILAAFALANIARGLDEPLNPSF